jgi:hypothetical protein
MPTGVPHAIISVSMAHMLFIISMLVPSAGIIVHFMPLSVIEQVMSHIIGIIEAMGIEPILVPGMFMDCMDIGICAAFMAGPYPDNEWCWNYNRTVSGRNGKTPPIPNWNKRRWMRAVPT